MTNALARDFVSCHEGCRLEAYADQGGRWTIGWGTTGPSVMKGTVWTQSQADAARDAKIDGLEASIRSAVSIPLTQQQSAALISFSYNVGFEAFATSTLCTLIKQRDWIGAAKQFQNWDHVNKKDDKGLLIRRFEEAALFLRGSP